MASSQSVQQADIRLQRSPRSTDPVHRRLLSSTGVLTTYHPSDTSRIKRASRDSRVKFQAIVDRLKTVCLRRSSSIRVEVLRAVGIWAVGMVFFSIYLFLF